MLWSAYVALVDEHLAVEADRRGLKVFRARYLKNAVIDLQRVIPAYREANKTTYTAADLTAVGAAHLATLPAFAEVKRAYIYDASGGDVDPQCARYELDFYPWNRRKEMICGQIDFAGWWGCCGCQIGQCPSNTETVEDWCQGKPYLYALSPMVRQLLVFPQITDSTRLLLVWNGYKREFADNDEVPYPIESAEAAAAYVLWKIAANVDKDQSLAASRATDYARLRLALFRDARDRDSLLDQQDEEYDANAVNPP